MRGSLKRRARLFKEFKFLGRGGAPEFSVSMRKAAKLLNNPTMSLGIVQGISQRELYGRRRRGCKFLKQFHPFFLHFDCLRVLKGNIEKGTLNRPEFLVKAPFKTRDCNVKRLRVLGISLSLVTIRDYAKIDPGARSRPAYPLVFPASDRACLQWHRPKPSQTKIRFPDQIPYFP